MPQIPQIDPALQTAKSALVQQFVTSSSQPDGEPPPQRITPAMVTSVAVGMPDVLGVQSPQQLLLFVEDSSDADLAVTFNRIKNAAGSTPFTVLRSGRCMGQAAPAAGSSISVYAPLQFNVPQVTAGTLGAIGVDSAGKHHILGSNHVIAYNGRAPHGTPVVTPGTLDDTVASTVVGSQSGFVELIPAVWPVTESQSLATMNTVDCAMAELTPAGMAMYGPFGAGVGPTDPANIEVHKTGRTTGLTRGSICILDWEGFIDLSFGTFYFRNLMGVFGKHGAFAAPGDSGAVVIDDVTNAPVGMVVARVYSAGGFLPDLPNQGPFTGYFVFMCSMVDVCERLGIRSVILS